MYRATFDQQNQQTAAQQVTYTAFGEPVAPDGAGGWTVGGELPIGMSRSGYAGGHGYESGMITLYGENSALPPITLLHVGERWYNPSTGRFVQRDPIGLRGGLNVYAYCGSQPMTAVDPSGLGSWGSLGGQTVYNGWRRAGKTPEQASSLMADGAETELAIGLGFGATGAACVVLYFGGKGVASVLQHSHRLGLHGPHHNFPGFGRLPHVQWNWWRAGVKGSGGVFRLPLTPMPPPYF